MGPGAWGEMLVRRVGSGGVEGRGPEVLGGRRSAVRRLGVRRPANIIGNIRRGSENIITNIRRVLGGSAGGLGGRGAAVRRSGLGGSARIGGSPYNFASTTMRTASKKVSPWARRCLRSKQALSKN